MGGIALFIDYGHERSAPGDTLQAVRGHAFAPVLHDPGEQDLTAHVDFEAVAHAAAESGATATAVVTQGNWDYIYEPDARELLDGMMRRYTEAIIFQMVNENLASEQSARMVAMKAASDNAKTVIGELQLVYNKSRQAAITKELSEIVGGAAAV